MYYSVLLYSSYYVLLNVSSRPQIVVYRAPSTHRISLSHRERKKILPLVRNNSYTSLDIKNFPGRIRKPEKSTQALSVYRKGIFRVYIKCLIVASSKVTIKRRGRKKGHCLSYRFERYMEFGDASDEEAPPAHPNKKDLTKSLRMQIVSMLQGMENDGSLPRGHRKKIQRGMLHSSLLMEEGGAHAHHRPN